MRGLNNFCLQIWKEQVKKILWSIDVWEGGYKRKAFSFSILVRAHASPALPTLANNLGNSRWSTSHWSLYMRRSVDISPDFASSHKLLLHCCFRAKCPCQRLGYMCSCGREALLLASPAATLHRWPARLVVGEVGRRIPQLTSKIHHWTKWDCEDRCGDWSYKLGGNGVAWELGREDCPPKIQSWHNWIKNGRICLSLVQPGLSLACCS